MLNPISGENQLIGDRFAEIYDQNEWHRGSGVGSMPENNIDYMAFLQKFIRYNRIGNVVDFGCGDWQFSRYIDWSDISYHGLDIVPKVIEKNRNAYQTERITFSLFDSIAALPEADLIICKDVFQHLPNAIVHTYLGAMKSKAKFLLITNDIGPPGYLNLDIEPGGWRTLQFDLPPFSEEAGIVLEWTVHAGMGWTRKATYLFYGSRAS
jgi:SAM-dependent methyltransferase